MRRSRRPSRALFAVAVAALAATALDVEAAAAQSPKPLYNQPIATDPVGSAIAEASRRFGVPEHWIRSVMRVESAGNARAVSHAGAIGLMQVMPATYAELRRRHGFGPDPFDVRDSVLAGAAYLREMFDRYGAQGMLAAYNAGPGRWEEHLAGRRALPGETVGYLARLAPMLDPGAAVPLSIERPAARPSPFAAPILVTLNGSPRADSTTTEAPSLHQIIAANTTIVPSSGELFVRRSSPRAASIPPEPIVMAEDSPQSQARPEVSDDSSVTASNALFVSRAITRER